MIREIEFLTEARGVQHALRADKDPKGRNKWLLGSIEGNGLPPVEAMGKRSHGLHGRSYDGVDVDAREIEVRMYAAGYSAEGCQTLLDASRRVVSVASDGLGVLRLTNAAGAAYRILARCTAFDVTETRKRSAMVEAVFDCPRSYFEDDVLHIAPVYTMTGGKEWPKDSGLERPYTFGSIQGGTGGVHSVEAVNAGDVDAPVVVRLSGAGLTAVTVKNETTGASIVIDGLDGAAGLELCTDPYDTYARFADGSDASRYVSLFSSLADFALVPGTNGLVITMEADSLNVAGTQIEWRGRYSTCL